MKFTGRHQNIKGALWTLLFLFLLVDSLDSDPGPSERTPGSSSRVSFTGPSRSKLRPAQKDRICIHHTAPVLASAVFPTRSFIIQQYQHEPPHIDFLQRMVVWFLVKPTKKRSRSI